MAKNTPIINNFNAGELSPLIDARVDVNKYYNGCRTLENFIPLVEGGIKRMPGTYYVCETKDSPNSKKSIFIPFKFSTTQEYPLEFGEYYIRFCWPPTHGQILWGEDMDEFDPSSAYHIGELAKAGESGVLTFSGDRNLVVAALYGEAACGKSLLCESNGSDNLSVTTDGTVITIKLANSTASKNTGALIQTALRALSLVGAVDVSEWTVTEDPAYAASKPTSGISGIVDDIDIVSATFRCTEALEASATNTNFFPKFGAPYWEEVDPEEPVEIVTPYLESELYDIKYCQSYDVLYLTHPNHPPAKLIRYSHTEWEYKEMICSGSVGIAVNIISITKADPAVVKVTDISEIENGDLVYISGVVGMIEVNDRIFTVANRSGVLKTFQLTGEDSTGYTTYSSGGTVIKTEQIFNATGDYPSCVAIYDQRLVFAGSDNHPSTINFSKVGYHEIFILDPATDDAAMEFTIGSERIRWLVPEDYLLIGALDGVWKVGGTTDTEPLTQTNVSARRQIGLGSSNTKPEVVIDSILWLTRGRTNIRQIMWNLTNEKYMAPSMTRIAGHICFGSTEALSGIIQTTFQKEPMPIYWGIRKDGQLIGLTYEIQESVYAFFRVPTDGMFESAIVVSKDGGEDEIWAMVARTIDEDTLRYIEYFKPQNFYSLIEDCFFVHSGLSKTLTDDNEITGLNHLALKNVDVIIDGVYIGEFAVSAGGVVDLGDTYSGECHVGLPFTSKAEPMKLNPISTVIRGKQQRVNRILVALYETCGGKIGPDANNLQDIDITSIGGILITDDIEVEYGGDWENETTLCIVQDEPYPMTILCLIPELNVGER